MSRARVHEIDQNSPAWYIREALKKAGMARKELIGEHISRRDVQNVLDDNKPMSPEFIMRVATLTDVSLYHLVRLQTNWLMKQIERQRKGLRKVLNSRIGCCCGAGTIERTHFLPGDERNPKHYSDCPYVQAARALGFDTRG